MSCIATLRTGIVRTFIVIPDIFFLPAQTDYANQGLFLVMWQCAGKGLLHTILVIQILNFFWNFYGPVAVVVVVVNVGESWRMGGA